jgi:lactoylglutathione lyase
VPVIYEDENSAVVRFENMIVNLLVRSAAHELIAPGAVATQDAAVCAALATRGVTLLNGPMNREWGMRTACFADPDGHIWEIAQQLPEADG